MSILISLHQTNPTHRNNFRDALSGGTLFSYLEHSQVFLSFIIYPSLVFYQEDKDNKDFLTGHFNSKVDNLIRTLT